MLQLDWAHIDLARGVLLVDGTTDDREVPLTPRAKRTLAAVPEEKRVGRLLSVSRGSVTAAIVDGCDKARRA